MTTLYICKGGIIIPRDPEKTQSPKPTVVTYRHTIRQITDNQCNCKEEKERLTKQFEAQLLEKDGQIIALVNRIADKETEIDKLQTEMTQLRNPKIAHHTPVPKEENIFQLDEGLWDRMEKTLNSTVISSFSLGDISSGDFTNRSQYEIQKTERQMDDCFKKTSILMSDIEGIMKKKRKYEFYNPVHVENSIIEQIDNSQEKQQEESQQILMQDTFCRPMSEDNDDYSLDMTTFEYVQNFGQNSGEEGFYSKLLQDSIQLKNTIMQMREESMQEIREVEEYYQKQLIISFEQLEKERNKNSLIEMTKNKLIEITNKGRQALAELDQNQGFNWDIGDKKLMKTSILIDESYEQLLR